MTMAVSSDVPTAAIPGEPPSPARSGRVSGWGCQSSQSSGPMLDQLGGACMTWTRYSSRSVQ